jgi:hypothetical protein
MAGRSEGEGGRPEAMLVAVRVRPMNDAERAAGAYPAWRRVVERRAGAGGEDGSRRGAAVEVGAW